MLSFDKTLKSYKQVITEIAKVLEYDDKDFSKVAKSQLYSYHEKLAKVLQICLPMLYQLRVFI